MTETTMETRGAFGVVLEDLMRSRGLATDEEAIRALGQLAGLNPEALLSRVRASGAEEAEDLGYLDDLAQQLALTLEERRALAYAYSFERLIGEDVRRAQRGEATQ